MFANLLDIVPVGSADERQIVLQAVSYYADGMTPFDAFHAATAETHSLPIISSDKAFGKSILNTFRSKRIQPSEKKQWDR